MILKDSVSAGIRKHFLPAVDIGTMHSTPAPGSQPARGKDNMDEEPRMRDLPA
jgi:hypothetical protein